MLCNGCRMVWRGSSPYIAAYGTLTIFIIIYFEVLGAPLPGESGLAAIAALATRGDVDYTH